MKKQKKSEIKGDKQRKKKINSQKRKGKRDKRKISKT